MTELGSVQSASDHTNFGERNISVAQKTVAPDMDFAARAAIDDFKSATRFEIAQIPQPIYGNVGSPESVIREAFAELDQARRTLFVSELIRYAGRANSGRNINASFIAAMDPASGHAIAPTQLGFIIREAFYSGRIDAGDLALLFTTGTGRGSSAADVILATDNANIKEAVSRAIIRELQSDPPRDSDIRGEVFGTAVLLAHDLAESGNTSRAKSLTNQLFADDELRFDLVPLLLEHSEEGVAALVSLIHRLDQHDIVRKDVSETIFQDVLKNAGDGRAFRTQPEVLSQLNSYFNNNLDRLIEEAADPRVADAAPTGTQRTINQRRPFREKEQDDNELLSLFVTNVVLNPAADSTEIGATIASLRERADEWLEMANDTSFSDAERLDAAEKYGFVVGGLTDGLAVFAVAESERSAPLGTIGGVLLDVTLELVLGGSGRVLKATRTLLKGSKDTLIAKVADPQSIILRGSDGETGRLRADILGILEGGLALLPDDTDTTPAPLSAALEAAYRLGYESAARPDPVALR